jgi:hypothetical protein
MLTVNYIDDDMRYEWSIKWFSYNDLVYITENDQPRGLVVRVSDY